MLTLPDAIVPLLVPFATLFTSPTWRKAQLLPVGTILTPGQRTVAAALRVMGRRDQGDYARYHEVLNRAVWSSREVARILLLLLLQHLDRGDGPLIFGIDETLERRRGAKIRARPSTATQYVPDGGVVPLGQATRHHSLGADPRPPGRLRPPGPALYRPGGGPDPDPGMVCPALVRLWRRGHLSGGQDPPGRGNPTPVVRPGHRPYHSHPAGSLFLDHSCRSPGKMSG